MPTYIYESMPTDGTAPARFEVVQRMTEEPLSVHPETGEPVRRIITGGQGIKGQPLRRSTVVNKNLAAATPCGCSTAALAQATGRPAAALGRRHAGHSHGPHRHRH
jgi:hypothetical protein